MFIPFILLAGCSSSEAKDLINIKNERLCPSDGTPSYFDSVIYKDDFFNNDSSIYNEHLATLSSQVGFVCAGGGFDGIFTGIDVKVSKFLSQLGFSDIYFNEDYSLKPTRESLGVVIARKKIGSKTLLLCATRNMMYEREWFGNIDIGDSSYES